MNRFFKYNDKKVSKLGKFKIPDTWWSRPYEYAFAKGYLVEGERILDVGCGLEHPFKIFASNTCEVVAIDKDDRVMNYDKGLNKLDIQRADILTFKDEQKFDKIFCISVLEHTQSYMIEKLKNMKELLKHDGLIVSICYWGMLGGGVGGVDHASGSLPDSLSRVREQQQQHPPAIS